ncbi:N-6 DNA methylase [Candidatus Bathyarchaeota archaeon]|nr:N-6 DNA methylase [Candidatus Bathyarchaeota archaeon]
MLKVARQGDAREESYYSALETLLSDFAISKRKKEIRVTSQPKKTDAGNPDFRVWDGRQKIVGYVEAKTPDKNLDDVEKTEQVKRYRTTFPNFILTNFFEFRFYRGSSLVDKVRIADPIAIHTLKGIPSVTNEEAFENLLEKFFSFSFPSITSAQPLAVELAKRTRFLRDEVIAEELREAEKNGIGKIIGFYEAFQRYLIRGLTKEQFADLYSQTITYGLFASRMRCEGDFNRRLAVYDIPRSIGILREMFEFISLGDLPPQLEWIVDEISNVLANVDVKKIFSEYYHNKKGEDPVFHFYETFLAEYDPAERERRGVYYTPKPIVSYIVRSLDLILKEKFGLADGLANGNVTILDPAAGTLTFIAEAIKQAVNEFTSKYGEGGKEGFIKEHIMKNFYAFELMIAPYAIGHVKISFLLEELGHRIQDEDVRFYLTNTLELEDIEQTSLPGMASLAEESRKAGEVKKRTPILCILGNPPYSVSSANKSEFIEKEMELYKEDVRDEKNIQPLSDDYIKFIRFAHWKIEKNGKGVIGYISNNSYLTGIIHRGMRKELLETFDEVYVLNLHGSSRIREKAPNGGKDENVFDIQQGVTIALFVKFDENKKMGRVFHKDVWGLRKDKYNYLENYDVNTTEWTEIFPAHPYYFFEGRRFPEEEYKKFVPIVKIFQRHSSGVTTHRDHFVVGFLKKEIENRMKVFTGNFSDEEVTKILALRNTDDFNIETTRQSSRNQDWSEDILPYSYRPFDERYICYRPEIIDRDRYQIMRHFLNDNLGLVVMRQYLYDFVKIYNYVFAVDKLSDRRLFISNRGAGFVFPLYLYPSVNSHNRRANVRTSIIQKISESFGKEIQPEEIFFYVYAVLHSVLYRSKFGEYLKIEFPRIPFTTNSKVFTKIAKLGKKLIDLHLLKSEELRNPIAKFQGKGDNSVKRPMYNEEKGLIYINEKQYFEGIEKGVWEYQIGDYQILYKWLKDRKGRKLSLEDIKHYCRVATALARTIEIQDEIDKLYPNVEEDIIEFKESNKNLGDYTQ